MRVALFVTCLIDLMRPSAGFASLRLLQRAGCEVIVPAQQTCCGQPAYNNGDQESARAIARQVIDYLDGFSHVVIPSGSCAGMLVRHYPSLFDREPAWRRRAEQLAGRCHELTRFLVEVTDTRDFQTDYTGRVVYHDACSARREMQVYTQPRDLLDRVTGLTRVEASDNEQCCGFGGTFSVKFGDISTAILDKKVEAISNTGADTLVAGDLGCLLNIAGRLSRQGIPIRAFHIAELLAGMTDRPLFPVHEP